MEKKNIKLLIFIGFVLLCILLHQVFDFSRYLSVEELKKMKAAVDENYILASVIYVLVTMIGSVVLALPGVSFAIAAGVLFGAVYGTFLCTLAASLGAMLSFIAGRYFLQDKIKPLAMKNKYLRKYLFEDIKKNEIFILMMTRLVPIFPFNLQNFAYGITDMSLYTYSIFTFIFILPGSAMYTIGAAALIDEERRSMYIGISILLAILIFLAAFLFKKYIVDKEVSHG